MVRYTLMFVICMHYLYIMGHISMYIFSGHIPISLCGTTLLVTCSAVSYVTLYISNCLALCFKYVLPLSPV